MPPKPVSFVGIDVDWSRSDRAIARDIGCAPQTVGKERRRLGLWKPRKYMRVSEGQWRAVDWSLIDRKIAARLGCDAKTVWQKRRDLGHFSLRGPLGVHSPQIDCWDRVDWSHCDRSIATHLRCSIAIVRLQREARNREIENGS